MTTPSTPPDRPNSPAPAEPAHPHHLEQQRRANRDAVAQLGLLPYGLRTDGIMTIEGARTRFDEDANTEFNAKGKEPGYVDRRPVVRVAGRVVLHRDNGKLIWMNLRDQTGDVQVAVSQRDCQDQGFPLAKLTDLGDVVVAAGRLMKTKTGEITVWAKELLPASKCLVPPPEKHAGLQDVEIRYRQRYLDLWSNPETLKVFELRSRLVSRIRAFMQSRGYLEVETPMLQTLAGGAAARPFVTHMNAMDIKLFMRIAPELYLKRLLVGGMPKVFEVNRNFRNEGLDKQHNPEFTMLEAYHAFGDLNIDFARPFERVSYASLFEKAYGFPITDGPRAKAELKKRRPNLAAQSGAHIDAMDDILVVNELFEDKEHGGEAQLDHARPTFITDYPAAISPLTRPKRDNPVLADRADLFIAGMEIAPHYTELNDPDVQEQKFREQLKGLDAEKNAEENTFRTFDEDFIRALKVGMPPAGGMGLGVDRLVMILTNQRTIRDVMLFPMMRPE